MLLTKTIKIKWHPNNKNHYEEKGYIFTNFKDEFEVKVEDLMDGCNEKVEVKCDCPDCKDPYLKPIIWQSYKKQLKEENKYYCKKCVLKLYNLNINKKRMKSFIKNGKSFEQWCIENNKQNVLNRWDYELNDCKPSEVSCSSHGYKGKGYYFKCPNGIHESEMKHIDNFTKGFMGSMECVKCNSFAQWGIDNIGEDFLEKYWDYEKNIRIDPWKLSYGSGKKVWIKCQEKKYHGSYYTSCVVIHSGCKCPYCNGNGWGVHPKDSLGQYIIDNYGEEFLNSIWSEKNKKTAFQYDIGSSKKHVWWKCPDGKHDDYKRKISVAVKSDFRCPDCVSERRESFLQEKVRLYLESLGYVILHENKCTIVPKNPKTNYYLPFDNEIFELKTIIEVHGKQHYEICGFHVQTAKKHKTTPKYEFYYQKLKDRYKKIYSYIKGYQYLEISYLTDNENEEWKQLIDDKIKKITNEIIA